MKKSSFCMVLVIGILFAMPARAGLFSGCDEASKEPMPVWVSKVDYSLPGYYVGVGSAVDSGRNRDEQIRASEDSAKSHLVQQIEVTIRAENEQSTRVSNDKVQKDILSKVTVSAEEVLRDLQVKARWTDKESCTLYTLMTISKSSVAHAKREKLMRSRLAKFKSDLAEGSDRDKNRDVKVRRKYLENAKALLDDTDFSLLPDELGKTVYAKRLDDAMANLNKAVSQVKGRTALFAINRDGALHSDVIGKMLDQLRAKDATADRLMSDCTQESDCITVAKERGFTTLTLLKADSRVSTSPMGALKGTLTVSRVLYDIDSRKILKGPDTVSAQVIGWSNSELDWNAAAEKAMQGFQCAGEKQC